MIREPITIPLTGYQRAQLARLEDQAVRIKQLKDVAIEAIIASQVDPVGLQATYALTDGGLVLTPVPARPALAMEA